MRIQFRETSNRKARPGRDKSKCWTECRPGCWRVASHLDLSPVVWVPATELFLRGFSLPAQATSLLFPGQPQRTGWCPLLHFSSPGEEGGGREMMQEQQLGSAAYCLNWAEGKRGTAGSAVGANILPISGVCVGRKSGPSSHPFSALPSEVPEEQAQSCWQGQAFVGELAFSVPLTPGQASLAFPYQGPGPSTSAFSCKAAGTGWQCFPRTQLHCRGA